MRLRAVARPSRRTDACHVDARAVSRRTDPAPACDAMAWPSSRPSPPTSTSTRARPCRSSCRRPPAARADTCPPRGVTRRRRSAAVSDAQGRKGTEGRGRKGRGGDGPTLETSTPWSSSRRMALFGALIDREIGQVGESRCRKWHVNVSHISHFTKIPQRMRRGLCLSPSFSKWRSFSMKESSAATTSSRCSAAALQVHSCPERGRILIEARLHSGCSMPTPRKTRSERDLVDRASMLNRSWPAR